MGSDPIGGMMKKLLFILLLLPSLVFAAGQGNVVYSTNCSGETAVSVICIKTGTTEVYRGDGSQSIPLLPFYQLANCTGVITEGHYCWDTVLKTLCIGDGTACSAVSAVSMAIGGAVGGGATSGSIPYVDASGNMAQDNASLNFAVDTGTLTADIIATTGTDPKVTVPNADAPASLADGDLWVDTGVDAVGISDGTNKYYARPDKMKTCAENCSVAATELNAIVTVTAAATVTLPPVAANIYGARVCAYSTGANVISIDPNAADRIILAGVALNDGNKINTGGAAGDFMCLICDGAAGWIAGPGGRSGTWTDGS